MSESPTEPAPELEPPAAPAAVQPSEPEPEPQPVEAVRMKPKKERKKNPDARPVGRPRKVAVQEPAPPAPTPHSTEWPKPLNPYETLADLVRHQKQLERERRINLYKSFLPTR